VQGRPGVVRVKRFRSVTVPYGTIYDMVVDATNRHLVTGGQDKHLNVWNLSNGKPLRSCVSCRTVASRDATLTMESMPQVQNRRDMPGDQSGGARPCWHNRCDMFL